VESLGWSIIEAADGRMALYHFSRILHRAGGRIATCHLSL
jgi:hypothetical protein